MGYELKLHTGFYRTTHVDLSLFRDGLLLRPLTDGPDEPLLIPAREIRSIAFVRNSHSQIHIQTDSRLISGTFTKDTDLRSVFHSFRQQIVARMTYEESN